MHTSFAFYDHPPPDAPRAAGFRRTSGRGASLALPLDDADRFDKRGYGSARWSYLAVDAGIGERHPERPAGAEPVLAFEADCVLRARGPRDAGEAGVALITLVDLARSDEEAFLAQFVRATAVMSRRVGFRAARLFRALSGEDRATYLNLAFWRSVEDFVEAFSSAEFRAVLTGGFETRSTIVTAHIPGDVEPEGAR